MKLQPVSILRSMTRMFSPSRTRAACLPLARTCALAAVLLAGAADAAAQMFVTTGRDTLRGLPGVELAVESLPPELEREGLNGAAIRAAVDRRLRAAGVRLFASQSENPSDAKPYLYVHVNALEIPGASVYAIAIQVHLRQTLRSCSFGTTTTLWACRRNSSGAS